MIDANSALLTDLYQLTMLQGYHDAGMNDIAVFELFVRKLPEHRNFFVAAGLEQALDYLENLRFSDDACDFLAESGFFTKDFIGALLELRFTGDVAAMPEGTVFFPDEPVLRVTAPLPEAQLVETRLINLIHFQTMIASKAVRSRLAAPDRFLVDFGLRRAHGSEAGLLAARACYLAGFAGTSNVLATKAFGIPMYGTMAHSFIMAHDDERSAFENFARSQPQNVVLLIDTYDTEAGAMVCTELAPALRAFGASIKGVRLDSGDLLALSKKVRRILDDGGLKETHIFASGDLDEFKIHELLQAGAPIDGFGIGTQMITSADQPNLNCAYKLQEYAGKPRRKYSSGKITWPGRKQVYRHFDGEGRISHDVITLDSDHAGGEPLLIPVMANGRRIAGSAALSKSRDRLGEQIAALPDRFRSVVHKQDFRVDIAQPLRALAETMRQEAF